MKICRLGLSNADTHYSYKANQAMERNHTVILQYWTLKKGLALNLCLPALLRIHRNTKQKEFLKSCEGLSRTILTGHGLAAIPALSQKLPKWHFLIPECNWEFFGPNDFIWKAMKVPCFDFIQNMSQALSKCLSERINWIISKIHLRISKILFV